MHTKNYMATIFFLIKHHNTDQAEKIQMKQEDKTRQLIQQRKNSLSAD